MKKYIIPAITIADIENEVILAGSGGVTNDGTVGDSYDESAPSYTNKRGLFDWNED